MSDTKSLAEELVAVVLSDDATYDDAMAAAGAFLESAAELPATELGEVLSIVGPGIEASAADRAGIAAITCGALVENGAPPGAVVGRLLDRLAAVVPAAADFVDACRAHYKKISGHVDCEHEHEVDEYMSPTVMRQLAEHDAAGEQAWVALDLMCRPTIAMLTRDAPSRVEASTRGDLLEAIDRLSGVHSGPYFLWSLLAAPIDEELLVLAPLEGVGARVRISGIVDNFQLHTLLADRLIGGGHLDGESPDPAVVEVAAGLGPQSLDLGTAGCWNMAQWRAVDGDGVMRCDAEHTEYWVWNEGSPRDIEFFEGTRVLLLGPPAYARTWAANRMFDALEAECEVLEILGPEAVGAWLARFALASKDG